MRLDYYGRIAVIIDSIGGSSELIKSISTGNRVCISSNSGGKSRSKTLDITGTNLSNKACIFGKPAIIISAICCISGIAAAPILFNNPPKASLTFAIVSPSTTPAFTVSPT